MATVTFSAADDVLYAYLAGEIDHSLQNMLSFAFFPHPR